MMGLDQLERAPLQASLTDPLGRQTRWELDSRGRATSVQANDGGLTTFVLDSAGRVTDTTDPGGGGPRWCATARVMSPRKPCPTARLGLTSIRWPSMP